MVSLVANQRSCLVSMANLRKRGEMDGLQDLQNFGDQLEAACFDTLNDGIATKDLVNLMEGVEAKPVNSAGFIAAIRERLEKRLA